MKKFFLLLAALCIMVSTSAQSSWKSSWYNPNESYVYVESISAPNGGTFSGNAHYVDNQLQSYVGIIVYGPGNTISGTFGPNFGLGNDIRYQLVENYKTYEVYFHNGNIQSKREIQVGQNPGSVLGYMPNPSSQEPCRVCNHTGNCSTCNGTGRSPNHASGIHANCGACGGTGRCATCRGTGYH